MERNFVLVALFAALIAALGLVPNVTLAFGVPISAQSLGVMLAGTVLGARRGALAVLLFLLLPAIGLPVLSGGRGGIGVFVGPTAGFLFGFPIAAFAAGWIMERLNAAPVFWAASFSALIGGIFVMYVPGVLWLAFTIDKSLYETVLLMAPFIPGDIVKVILAGAITATLVKWRPGSVPTRA